MEKKPYPSETQDRFLIRFPDGGRDRIAAAAKANKRSMNAEIVARIDRSFSAPELSDELIVTLGVLSIAMKEFASSIDPAILPEEKRRFVALLEQAATQVFEKLPTK